jgi:hypothetical protein
VLGILEPDGTPNIYENKLKNTFVKELKNWEAKNLRKSVFLLQSHEPLYTCPSTPFIGRWRDFYIPKVPSDLKNNSNWNMYINVFYIS